MYGSVDCLNSRKQERMSLKSRWNSKVCHVCGCDTIIIYQNIEIFFQHLGKKKKNLKPIILFHESHFFSQKRGWTLNRQLRKAYCQAEAARLLRVRVLGLRLGPRPLLLSHLTADPQYEPEIIKILLFLFHPSCALYCKSVTLGTH